MIKAIVLFAILPLVFVHAAFAAGESGVTTTSATWPLGMVQSNEWGVAHAHVSNPSDSSLNAMLITEFDAASGVQFAMPVWVPPHAARGLDVPVHAPALSRRPGEQFALPTTTLLLSQSGAAGERQLAREPGLLPLNKKIMQIAVVRDRDDDATQEFVLSLLNGTTSRVNVSGFSADHLPAAEEGLAPFRTIFLAYTQQHPDAAQRQALRRWLIEGGRLVILGTRLSQEDALLLLGEDWSIQPVSHVELHDFQMVPTGGRQIVHLESAVDMLRVLAPGMVTVASANGWPAELRKSVGAGELTVLTTSADAFAPIGFRTNNAGQSLAEDVLLTPAIVANSFMDSAATSAAFSGLAAQQVSYAIVSRAAIAMILGAFLLALAITGSLLAFQKRLEWIAGVGVLFALAATGVLIFLGSAHQLPLTLASAQYAIYVPGQRAVLTRSQLQVFSPTASVGALQSTSGGQLWPDLETQSGSLVRLVHDDVDAFHWENLHLPAGAAVAASVRNVLPVSRPIAVTGEFGADGLRLRYTAGALERLADLVLFAPHGDLAPVSDADGSLLFNAENELPARTYLNGSLLSETQRQRQIVYGQLMAQRPLVRAPFLMGWSDAGAIAAGGISLPTHFDAHAVTLVELPVELRQTAPNTRLHIPAPFIPFTLVRGKEGLAPAYDMATGQWISNISIGVTLHFRFELPRETLPLHVEKATFHISVRAPGRTVETLLLNDNAPAKVVDLHEGPVVPYDIVLTGADAQPTADGFINVTVRVGNVEEGLRTWDVYRMSMDVQGTTLAPEAMTISSPA